MLRALGKAVAFTVRLIFVPAVLVALAAVWWFYPYQPKCQWQVPTPLREVWLSHSGHTLIALSDYGSKGRMTVWDLSSGNWRFSLPEWPYSLWMSADDRFLAFTSTTPLGHLHVYDLERRIEQFSMEGAGRVEFASSDGKTVFTEMFARVDLQTGEIRPCSDLLAMIKQCGWRPGYVSQDGKVPLTLENKLTVWDLERECFLLPIQTLSEKPEIELSGRWLTFINGRGVDVWDLVRGEQVARLEKPGRWPRYFEPLHRGVAGKIAVVFHPDAGDRSLGDSEVELWDLNTDAPQVTGSFHYPGHFSPGGKWFVELYDQTIWDTRSLERRMMTAKFSTSSPGAHYGPQITDDDRFCISLERRTNGWLSDWLPKWASPLAHQDAAFYARIVDLERDKVVSELALRPPITIPLMTHGWEEETEIYDAIRRLPSGQGLVTFGADGTIAVWDLPPRRPWWIEYGLPMLAVALVLGSGVRWWRRRTQGSASRP